MDLTTQVNLIRGFVDAYHNAGNKFQDQLDAQFSELGCYNAVASRLDAFKKQIESYQPRRIIGKVAPHLAVWTDLDASEHPWRLIMARCPKEEGYTLQIEKVGVMILELLKYDKKRLPEGVLQEDLHLAARLFFPCLDMEGRSSVYEDGGWDYLEGFGNEELFSVVVPVEGSFHIEGSTGSEGLVET